MPDSAPRAHVRRLIHAPTTDVFDAWTSPEQMARWMSPVGSATATVDLRVGGQFRLIMADEHLRIEHTGEYRVIQPPTLLVFTWRSEFTGMRETVVTVRITERDDGTELEVVHELATDAEANSHGGGWSILVDRLAAQLEWHDHEH